MLPLLAFLHNFLTEADVGHYWLAHPCVSKPVYDYDTQRWYVDDDFFCVKLGKLMRGEGKRLTKRRGWKLCPSLLGLPTLFFAEIKDALRILRETKAWERGTHQHEYTSTRCLECSTYAEWVRQSLAKSLREHVIRSSAPNELT
jgi:hypothetical protein